MKLKLAVCILFEITAALCLFNAHADPAMDREAAAINEGDTAKNLERGNNDLATIRRSYETALRDEKACLNTHPQLDAKAMQAEIEISETHLEIVEWEEEVAGKPDDPRGLRNVAAHLQECFSQAETLQRQGDLEGAQQEFEHCNYSWVLFREMHPDWQPQMVSDQIQVSQSRWMDLYIRKGLKKEYRYVDPKFGRPLSV